MYTAATETNRSTRVGKKCGLLLLFALQTRHAAGISSNKKGNKEKTQIKLCRVSKSARVTRTHPIENGLLPRQIVQVSFIKYTISFSIFPFLFYLFYKVNSLLTTSEHAPLLKALSFVACPLCPHRSLE